jgi:chemotaxis protein MotA
VHALWHPSEVVTIGGAAFGAMVIMAPLKVLKDLAKGLMQSVTGSPFNKKAHEELLKVMYDLFKTARKDGLLGLEQHVRDPHDSPMFRKYPLIAKNHHATEFISGLMCPLMDGSVTPDKLPDVADDELKMIAEAHHAPLSVLMKTADGLPGFGIVAAVLGIVITMGAIDGPVEEIGHKVGAALVGTFLGILLSYGFLAPLAVNLEFMGVLEMSFFRSIAKMVEGFAQSMPPKVVVEMARRGMPADIRPSEKEMEELIKSVDSSG